MIIRQRGGERIRLLVLVLLGWGAGAGCERTTEARRADPEPPPMRIGLEDTALVERGPVLTGALISGQLRAQDQATVRAQLAGQLTEMELRVGQRVSKGAVVARLRAIAERAAVGSATAAVATAETDLRVAKRDAERTEELVRAGARHSAIWSRPSRRYRAPRRAWRRRGRNWPPHARRSTKPLSARRSRGL